MYCDDNEDASKHFGQALHDFIMLICGCTLLLVRLLCLLEFSNVSKVLGIRNTWMCGGKLDGVLVYTVNQQIAFEIDCLYSWDNMLMLFLTV